MKVTLLGTGTPVPSLKRASSSYMVEAGGDFVGIVGGVLYTVTGIVDQLPEFGRELICVNPYILASAAILARPFPDITEHAFM